MVDPLLDRLILAICCFVVRERERLRLGCPFYAVQHLYQGMLRVSHRGRRPDNYTTIHWTLKGCYGAVCPHTGVTFVAASRGQKSASIRRDRSHEADRECSE